MNLKKLTQAVFDGLPKEYRWAAVDADGDIVIADHEHFFWHESKKWLFPSDKTIKIIVETIGCAASDWQNSKIERQDVPTADKPESIHDVARSIEAARVAEKSGNRCATCTANICSVIDDCYAQRAKEESARIEEQSERTYPHYFKDVSDVDAIDLYHVARLYDITDPALFHAFKKIACAGKRGAKNQAQDVQEAIDALKRWQELNA